MKMHMTAQPKQRTYAGRILATLGLLALATQLFLVLQPFEALAARFGQGSGGVLPALGMCLLNATHAIAFHQLDYSALIPRILVLFSAMLALVVGLALLRPRSRRTHIIELTLSPEFEGREMINGSR